MNNVVSMLSGPAWPWAVAAILCAIMGLYCFLGLITGIIAKKGADTIEDMVMAGMFAYLAYCMWKQGAFVRDGLEKTISAKGPIVAAFVVIVCYILRLLWLKKEANVNQDPSDAETYKFNVWNAIVKVFIAVIVAASALSFANVYAADRAETVEANQEQVEENMKSLSGETDMANTTADPTTTTDVDPTMLGQINGTQDTQPVDTTAGSDDGAGPEANNDSGQEGEAGAGNAANGGKKDHVSAPMIVDVGEKIMKEYLSKFSIYERIADEPPHDPARIVNSAGYDQPSEFGYSNLSNLQSFAEEHISHLLTPSYGIQAAAFTMDHYPWMPDRVKSLKQFLDTNDGIAYTKRLNEQYQEDPNGKIMGDTYWLEPAENGETIDLPAGTNLTLYDKQEILGKAYLACMIDLIENGFKSNMQVVGIETRTTSEYWAVPTVDANGNTIPANMRHHQKYTQPEEQVTREFIIIRVTNPANGQTDEFGIDVKNGNHAKFAAVADTWQPTTEFTTTPPQQGTGIPVTGIAYTPPTENTTTGGGGGGGGGGGTTTTRDTKQEGEKTLVYLQKEDTKAGTKEPGGLGDDTASIIWSISGEDYVPPAQNTADSTGAGGQQNVTQTNPDQNGSTHGGEAAGDTSTATTNNTWTNGDAQYNANADASGQVTSGKVEYED